MMKGEKVEEYERVKASYNANPNGADFLFLCRTCYGGVVRFRKHDGYMSTPCGPHTPIPPPTFAQRVDEWRRRVAGATFVHSGYEDAMAWAQPGDLVYCDPPTAIVKQSSTGRKISVLNTSFKSWLTVSNEACLSP